jgi:choline dehydrogenase-like flavoprotein
LSAPVPQDACPANRLKTRRPGKLLLEAGGKDWNPWIHVPVATQNYARPLDWCYKTEPEAAPPIANSMAISKVL